ncbi:MAG: FG-GAP-like repeat-containing protein, partial [Bacteroidota bacterium]
MPKIAYRLKTITLVILFALASTQLFAQVPTILSFSPQKGKYHDIDTINGNGFHTNVDSNFVFFGKVRAKVISATLNKLIVEIPRSAQSGPITITKGGLTTKSISEFIIYKEGGNYLDNTVLSNAGWIGSVSSDPLMSENQLVSGDFNLDGEIDIIETDVWGGSRLFINNKTYQMATSFSSFINLADNTGSKILGTADINNDGKMDIVSINKQYRKIYYFKNTSTTNAFSIDAPLVFNLQNSPRDFTINDFNNDGKLDLAITYDSIFSGTAGTSILLNISTNLDSLLFSSPISISGNYKGSKILSTDFNLDGKQDLIVSPISGTSQAVFLNNSSTSAVIFTPFSFSMNSMDKLFIGNVTLDGKPDIILHDGSYTIRIYENNVSGFTGSIDYYSYFNLNHINAPFNNVKYADINMDGFSDFIVYNSNYGRTTIYLQAKVPNAFNKRDFSLSTFFSSPNTTNNLILADLDSNYSQDMISFTNGLQLTRNDFFKPQPTIKSSNANIISLESFMAKCTVNKGNGSKRMVLLKKGTPITQLPVDYTIYAVKDSFGLGTLLEPDCYAMYIGNKDTFTFNNLRRKTRYYGAIIEFNGNDSGANFMDSAAYFDFQTKDQISTPATNLVVSSISDSSARISWTKGDGTHRLVLVSRGSDIPELVNFKTYRADNNFGYGDTLMNKYGYPACIVYADTGSFFDLNELSVSTKYYIRIIEYEIKTDSIYYSKLYSGSLFTWFFNTPKKIPRIDSIVPIKARPGDKVMIYGDNFDYDIFTNKVSYLLAKYNADISTAVTFGALKATEFNIVNKRLIEVIVPYGVTNDFVRVTRRFIGDSYSPKKFQPYFISKDTFGAGTYGSLNTIGIGWHSTTDSLNGIGVGDIDGNGKVRFLIQSGTGIMRTYGDGYYSDTYQLTTYGIVGQYVDGYSTGLTSHRTIEMNFDKDIDLDPDFIATSFSSWQNTAQKSILGSTDFNKDGKYDFLFIDADYNNFFNNRSIGIKMGTDDYLNWSINWNSGTQLLRASAINDFNN